MGDSLAEKIQKWQFFGFILLISLYTVRLVGPLTVADLGMVFFVGYSLVKYKSLSTNSFSLIYLLWLGVALLSLPGVVAMPYFSASEFISTLGRTLLSVLSLFVLPHWLASASQKQNIVLAVKNAVIFHSLTQILFVCLFLIGKAPFLNVVGHGSTLNRKQWLNVFDYTFYYRFCGVFEEPSWYAWFMIFCIGVIFSYEVHFKKVILSRFWMAWILLGFLFTFSISGLFSIAILMVMKELIKSRKLKVKHLLFIFFGSIVLVYAFAFLDLPFLRRITNILSGGDGSSNNRLTGSFLKAWSVLSNNFFGGGLGNSEDSIVYWAKGTIDFRSSIANQNGFLEAFISTGVLGGILYNLPFGFFLFTKRYMIAFMTVFLVFLTSNSILVAPVWVFISLLYFSIQDNSNEKMIT